MRHAQIHCINITGDDGVPLSAVVKIIKLAYCYEQWDVVDALLEHTISAIKVTIGAFLLTSTFPCSDIILEYITVSLLYQSINQSNFYSANVLGKARLSGVTAKPVFK